MSSKSTSPHRPLRGVPVPGINTRGLMKHNLVSLSYADLPSTPQAFHDSRRPSVASSSFSDTYTSGSPSTNGFSQPPTPTNSNVQHFLDFAPQWSPGVDMNMSSSHGVQGMCSQQMQSSTLSSTFPPTMCAVSGQPNTPLQSLGMLSSALGSLDMHTGQPSPHVIDEWSAFERPVAGLDSCGGLGTRMFETSQGLEHHSVPAYSEPSSLMQNQPEHTGYANYSTGPVDLLFSQPLQVVVPSQVSQGEDFPMEDYSQYEDHQGSDGLGHSFDAALTPYSPWDQAVSPSVLEEAYFSRSEDEEGMPIKSERVFTPMPSTSGQHSHRLVPVPCTRLGNRRRSSKRGRKHNLEGKAWCERDVGGTLVRCEGARFGISGVDDSGRLRVIDKEAKTSKKYRCVAQMANGKVCTAGFHRSEHLNRHMASHTKDKKYHCPLDECGQRIARPDNACDHFKTHLRKPVKGKRNKPHNWTVLEPLLFREYEEKAARKMVTNLRRWLWTENVKDDSGTEMPGFPLMQWHQMEAAGDEAERMKGECNEAERRQGESKKMQRLFKRGDGLRARL